MKGTALLEELPGLHFSAQGPGMILEAIHSSFSVGGLEHGTTTPLALPHQFRIEGDQEVRHTCIKQTWTVSPWRQRLRQS